MLGEKVGETRGRVTSRRILPGGDFRYIAMEITIEEGGTMLGMEAMNAGTYTAYERVPGQMYGEGNGIIGSPTGESAIWKGHGVGRMTGDGMGTAFRFSAAVQADPAGKLGRLNSVLVVGEHDVDGEGNTVTTWYESEVARRLAQVHQPTL